MPSDGGLHLLLPGSLGHGGRDHLSLQAGVDYVFSIESMCQGVLRTAAEMILPL